MNPFILWLILRVLTSFLAGIISSLRPIAPIELAVPLFSANVPVSQWIERALVSPWMRWDAEWYQRIVTQGYSASDGTAPFHPLYPWLATPLAKLGVLPGLSLLLVGSLAGIALFYAFKKLSLLDLPSKDASFSLMLFAFAPVAFILFAPYPEALFLLFAVLCLYFARKKTWWLAGIMGGLAVLTRQQGLFLLIPLAWELWETTEEKSRNLKGHWREVLTLGFIPLGLVIWLVYRAYILNDWQVSTSNFRGFIYSFLISPSADKVVPAQQFIWPWQVLWKVFNKVLLSPDVDIWINIILGTSFLILLAISWKEMRTGYKLYSLVITIASFSFYSGPVHPIMGLPRHLLLAFPVFIGLGAVIKRPWMRLLIIGLSAIGMAFLVIVYVLNAWVP